MIEIEFDLNQSITIIQANLKDSFQIVIDKYLQKSLLNPVNIYFLANGKQINPSESVESYMSDLNKQNKKLNILVQILEGDNKEQVIITSKNIICPECKEPCRISFDNYKIKLFDCDDGHITEDINIKDFENIQKINESKIICDKCKIKNKANCPDEQFYKCLTCNMNLCLLCKPIHNSNHNIIKYNQLNYICQKHNDAFDKYCGQCNLNICYSCEDHDKHNNNISLRELKPNIQEKKNILLKIKIEVDYFNNEIKNIINKLNDLINIMNIYYEIYNDIINNYETKNRNYSILSNIKEIDINNNIFEDVEKINSIKGINDKIINIVELYNKINLNDDAITKTNKQISHDINALNLEVQINTDILNSSKKDKLNEMTIIYNIDKNQDKLFIFDETFVKNNKNKCYILVEGEKKELCIYLNLSQIQKE